jgi:Mg2+ and Co2+ transporter CorA
VLRLLSRWLSEPVMGFLALAALSGGLAPLLFALPPRLALALDVMQWAIVGLFAAEYVVHLLLAADRWRYVRSPWRILDLVIILAPLVSLLPFASDFARSSPALRVLRLARVLLFGARARHGLAAARDEARREAAGAARVTAITPAHGEPEERSWPQLLHWLAQPGRAWLHAANLDESQLREVAARVALPQAVLEAALRETSYPRLESTPRWCAFTLSFPRSDDAPRSPVLLLVAEEQLLSLSLEPLALQRRPGFEHLPWGTRSLLHVVRCVLQRNEALAARSEEELRGLETLAADESPEAFFEVVFRLKRSLTLARGDLWRLRALLEMLADGRRELPGLGSERACVKDLAQQADYLHETVEKTQEALLALLDLHLNIASYGVNRFMRLLAVVSSLALIPTIVGGLLGMNILGNPWPVTLSQVAFATFILMLGVLYAFMAKGWLR